MIEVDNKPIRIERVFDVTSLSCYKNLENLRFFGLHLFRHLLTRLEVTLSHAHKKEIPTCFPAIFR